MQQDKPRLIDAAKGLPALLEVLRERGYTLIGPTVRDGAIVYEEISGVDDLPAGWTDEQEGGCYRLVERSDNALFGYAAGANSFKRFLHVPHQELWRAERRDGKLEIVPVRTETPKYAFIGIRSCEIHAIGIQDRVLAHDTYSDPHYSARRTDNLFIAVNCGHAGGTCFCVSMGTGPRVEHDYDLVLTELVEDGSHGFLVEAGSAAGCDLLVALPGRDADAGEIEKADKVVEATAGQMGRKLDAANVRDVLLENPEHSRWDDVAERCLSCGNCTLACPTCFCTTTTESSDLVNEEAVHSRQWDSCFNLEFSYLHGGSVRQSTRSRYRQWITHKLATWIDQFGTSGCVGCGRCITWCPVGIDITEEVRAMQDSEEQS